MNSFLLKIFVGLHNISYKIISKLSIKLNNNVHPKHEILNYHKFFVDHVGPTDTVIDIGCGKGENAYDISSKAKEVIAFDINEDNITSAKEHFKRDNLKFV
ncbi:methyltransferase domain-containing protein, partial [Patescibacteria group bacterium]|nr:methyltransferase domain-containing protein [Patescibacteria group bacterium]